MCDVQCTILLCELYGRFQTFRNSLFSATSILLSDGEMRCTSISVRLHVDQRSAARRSAFGCTLISVQLYVDQRSEAVRRSAFRRTSISTWLLYVWLQPGGVGHGLGHGSAITQHSHDKQHSIPTYILRVYSLCAWHVNSRAGRSDGPTSPVSFSRGSDARHPAVG